MKKVAKGVGGFVKSPVGQALGGALKNVAKNALPVVGGALGSLVAPGVGTAIGGQLGSVASGLFELELEGMDREQAEFEVARRFVRFATDATRNVALANQDVPPHALVSAAVADAARETAPGLLTGPNGDAPSEPATSGRWVRRGRRSSWSSAPQALPTRSRSRRPRRAATAVSRPRAGGDLDPRAGGPRAA